MATTKDLVSLFWANKEQVCWSQWPHGLRRRSVAARLLRSWVRIPPGAWMFVCCECCVLSDRGLCDELITFPGKSYRLWCVVVCDLENLKNEEAMAHFGMQRHKKRKKGQVYLLATFHTQIQLAEGGSSYHSFSELYTRKHLGV